MWGLIIAIISLVIVLTTSVALYFQQDKIKEDMNKKMSSIVDQINDSQFYEYKFDKQQEDNVKNIDRNISTLYDAVVDAQKNVDYLKVTTPSREEVTKNLRTGSVQTNVLNLGEKFRMSGIGDNQGNDDWLRLFDKQGNDFYGGFAAKNLWSRDNAWLNGNTYINGQLYATGYSSLKGGKSELNPLKYGTFLPHVDGKNYIRGDTEILGKVENIGSIKSDQMKVAHNFGSWTDNAVMSVYAPNGKIGASFGSELWSHFGWDGHTLLRPAKNGGDIYLGDMGTSSINVGASNVTTNVKGLINVIGKDGKKLMVIGDDGVLQINGKLKICDSNGSACRTLSNF